MEERKGGEQKTDVLAEEGLVGDLLLVDKLPSRVVLPRIARSCVVHVRGCRVGMHDGACVAGMKSRAPERREV